MRQHTTALRLAVCALWLMLCSLSFAWSQGMETEPNDTCPTAQDLGTVAVPFALPGTLDDPPEDLGVDFFRVTVTVAPDTPMQIDLKGAGTDSGTLADPFLGLFDVDCTFIDLNDDNGATMDSRILFAVPPGGTFIVAASSCCDDQFIGAGGSRGTYTLTITLPPPAIGSISGRVVNADTGEPLPGNSFPFAFVELLQCLNGDCVMFMNDQPVDMNGRFTFTRDFAGNPLPVGTYQIRAVAETFQEAATGPFSVEANEVRDLGDIPLMPPPPGIEAISGRVVNAFTGEPLPGDTPPFAFVELNRCVNGECFDFVNGQPTDSNGRFRFERDFIGFPIPAGTYQVRAFADGFALAGTDPFPVEVSESLDLGDLGLTPPPLRFSEIRPCGDLPPEGGGCRYSVRVTNESGDMLVGRAWSIIDGTGIAPLLGFTVFQTGRFGSDVPLLQRVSLDSGESRVLRFRFHVPPTVENGALVCAQAFVGEEPNSAFTLLGQQFLFCITKNETGFAVVPAKAVRHHLRRLRARRQWWRQLRVRGVTR